MRNPRMMSCRPDFDTLEDRRLLAAAPILNMPVPTGPAQQSVLAPSPMQILYTPPLAQLVQAQAAVVKVTAGKVIDLKPTLGKKIEDAIKKVTPSTFRDKVSCDKFTVDKAGNVDLQVTIRYRQKIFGFTLWSITGTITATTNVKTNAPIKVSIKIGIIPKITFNVPFVKSFVSSFIQSQAPTILARIR